VRLAIGAAHRQIITQALVESVLLAVAGGVAGLLVAVATARLLVSIAFANVQFLPIDTQPSLPVLAFAFGLALVTGIVCGAAPHGLPRAPIRSTPCPASADQDSRCTTR
jgi:ABC-type antimicrobial peptide transport system permease subunit